jgi:hypothetical protein
VDFCVPDLFASFVPTHKRKQQISLTVATALPEDPAPE